MCNDVSTHQFVSAVTVVNVPLYICLCTSCNQVTEAVGPQGLWDSCWIWLCKIMGTLWINPAITATNQKSVTVLECWCTAPVERHYTLHYSFDTHQCQSSRTHCQCILQQEICKVLSFLYSHPIHINTQHIHKNSHDQKVSHNKYQLNVIIFYKY